MSIGIIISAVFFVLLAIAALIGWSKGKKYVWQYTLTRLLINVLAVVISIPLTRFISLKISEAIYDKLFITGDFASAGGVIKILFAMIIGLILFFFVRLIIKNILKLFAPLISSLLISLTDFHNKKKADKNAIENASESEFVPEGDGSEVIALYEGEDILDRNESKGEKKKKSKRNGCYALKPQLVSILIGIVGCMLGVLIVFAPFTGLIGLLDEVAVAIDDETLDDTGAASELIDTVRDFTGNASVKVTNTLGGKLIFNSLTSYRLNGERVKLRDEVNLILVATNSAGTLADDGESKENKISSIDKILDAFDSSSIFPIILADVLNVATSKLEAGEEFMGITPPKVDTGNGEGEDSSISDTLFYEVVLTFKNSSASTVKGDVRTIGRVVEAIIRHDAFDTLQSAPEELITDKAVIKDVLTELFKNDRLSSLTSTLVETGINMLEDGLGVTNTLEDAYANLLSELGGIDTSLDDEEYHTAVRDTLIHYGLDVTDDGARELASHLKTNGVTSALPCVTVSSGDTTGTVNLSSSDDFVHSSLLVTKHEVVITHKDHIENPAHEAEVIANALSVITELADSMEEEAKISTLLKTSGKLLDALSESEMVGKAVVDKLLLVIFQSEKAADVLPMNTVEITNFVASLVDSTNDGEHDYEDVMTGIADMVDALSNASSSDDDTTDAVADALKNLTPETAEALKHVTTPEFVTQLGVDEKNSEAFSDILTGLFDEIAGAKESEADGGLGLTDEEYAAETEKISNLLDVTMSMTDGSEKTEDMEVGNYVDSVMDSKILTNTVINSVYDDDDNVKLDPLGSEMELSASEEEELLRTLNEKLTTVKNAEYETEADKEKATKDTEKLAIAVAAYMNTAVEVDSDGNLVIKS